MSLFELVFNVLFLAWALNFVGQSLVDTYVYFKKQDKLLKRLDKDNRYEDTFD